ncbi:autotransporter domain-containing protein [Candidatus Gracilibacteria bacterium]|nr:autotransporter domain-containing protein [Candidatus Gracilibacteria bacterium]
MLKKYLLILTIGVLINVRTLAQPIWTTSFGTRGTGDGQFNGPGGIAIDNKGEIYVTDFHNHRVQIFKNDTTYENQFQSSGISPNGQLIKPRAVAVDNKEKIYVACYQDNRVQIFRSDNTYESEFGSKGTGDGQFNGPSGIAVDNKGRIYITDHLNNRVQIFKSDNTYESKFGIKGTGDGQFEVPSGIAVDNTGKIYVADSQNNRVAVLFEPSLWNSVGMCTLGSLFLNQDLILNKDYHLVIKPMDANKAGVIVKSDGKLTITDQAILTANVGSSIAATSIVLDNATLILNTESISGNIKYAAPGLLKINNNITNNIDFAGHNGVLQLANGQTITGNVESSTSSAGTLEFLGKGIVTGKIEAINKLKLAGDLKSQTIKLNNAVLETINGGTIQGSVDISNSTIDLGSNTLRLTGKLSNNIVLKTKYNADNLVGGNIIVPSTLDLSNVDQLLIKLSYINSDISKIDDNTKYHLILAEHGGNIIPLYDPEQKILLDSGGEQNRFIKWNLDPKSLTLYRFDNANNMIDKDLIFDSQHKNQFMQALKSALPNSDAQKLKNNLGFLNKEQVEEMLSKLLDHQSTPDVTLVHTALQKILRDTYHTTINVILNRLNNSILPVSAGDDVDNCMHNSKHVDCLNRYGIWTKTTINHRQDKVSDNQSEYFTSYKTRGYSNTIGFDTLIGNDLLVGAAYTNTYTTIKLQSQNVGDIDKARTNMCSLYSSYHIPNYNLYINSTLSYGNSTMMERKTRNIALAKNILGTELAFGKYKSYLYSSGLSLGYYKHIKNNIYITPSLSVIGAVIRDKGYKEYGTSFQNLTVGAKSYNKFSSVLGLRILKNIDLGNTIVIPEVYGFINYNIKNKNPTINARLTGLDDCLPKIHYSTSKLDYNLGLGILLKQNMMEYSINYNINIAKKHKGHTGSVKLRANF